MNNVINLSSKSRKHHNNAVLKRVDARRSTSSIPSPSYQDLQKIEADYDAKFNKIIEKLDDLNQRTVALERNFLKVLHLLKDNILEAAERLNKLETKD